MLAPPDAGDPFLQSTKLMVRLKAYAQSSSPRDREAMLTMVGKAEANPVQSFRHAILAAELVGPEAAVAELDAVPLAPARTSALIVLPDEEARLAQHTKAVRLILAGKRSDVDEPTRQSLVQDHGYFGQLVLVFGLPDEHPERAPLVQGGGAVVATIMLIVVGLLVAVFGGLAACIVFFVLLGKGKIRPAFVPPARGGSVYLETASLFFVAFLALQIVMHALPERLAPGVNARLACQWLLLLVLGWPFLRGVSFAEVRQGLGLHAGKGLWREVGAGAFAYFAALPFIGAAIAIAIAAILIQRVLFPDAAPPTNPVQEIIGGAGPGTLVLIFLLATAWAPIMEEAIFRGALFRHVRSRAGVALATASTALAFGFMHGYALPLLLPVITLGAAFALMREWRGSLIAPMVAHFMHNATLLSLGIVMSQAMK